MPESVEADWRILPMPESVEADWRSLISLRMLNM